jgi:hypothetical protein
LSLIICVICAGSSIAWKATLVEAGLAQIHVTLAEQSLRLDRLDARVTRIEKRLELVEG